MCGGTQKTTSTFTPNPTAMGQYQTAWNMGMNAAQTPFQQYGGEFTAPINQTQQQATQAISGSADLYKPYYSTAQQLATRSAAPISVTPFSAEAIQQYQNPYTTSVVNATMDQLRQQQQMDQSNLKGQQLMAGAYGGSRGAIDRANLSRQQEMATGSTLSGILNQGYQEAVNTFQGQQQMSLAEQQANRQQEMAAAGLFGNLGSSADQMSLQNAQALMGAGTAEQQTQQNLDAAKYNEFLAGRQYPFQTAQMLGNLATGLGSLEGGTTVNQTPKPFFSDERVKENIHEIGKSYDGQSIYRYNYKGDPTTCIGFIAQDVEKKHPEAVGSYAGVKTVDYKTATEDSANKGHFASGGVPDNEEIHQPEVGSVSYVPQITPMSVQSPSNQTSGASPASSGSTLGDIADIAKFGSQVFSLFSDERVKENIQPIGETHSGNTIYRYNYKGDPSTQMGFLAQDIEKTNPDAVGSLGGIKTVNYDAATRQDMGRQKFADGGIPVSYVPVMTPSGGHSLMMPQAPAPQKTTSVLQDINSGIGQAKDLWNNLPKSAQTSLSSMNPLPTSGNKDYTFTSPNVPPVSQPPSSVAQAINYFSPSTPMGEGGLYARGGSIRRGYDIGGVADDDEDKPSTTPPIPSSLMGYPPLAPNSFGLGSTPMPNSNPREDAKLAFASNLRAMEGGSSAGASNVPGSSAYGPFQYTSGTWNDEVARHPELGMTAEDRMNPEKQKTMLSAHSEDLARNLDKRQLETTPSNLYASFFLGEGGGPRMIKAAQDDPNGAAYMNATPEAVNSNKKIFFKDDSTPRTNAEVYSAINQGISSGNGWNLNGNKQALTPPGNMPPANQLMVPPTQNSTPSTSQNDTQQSSEGGSMLSDLLTLKKEGLSPAQKGVLSGLFGMLGSNSTTLLGSLGEGGLKGMGAYENAQNLDVQRQLNQGNLERSRAQTALEQQRFGFEQQKLPYELQMTMAKINAQRAQTAAEFSKTLGFSPSRDSTTGQIVYTSPYGQTYNQSQMDQIRTSMINPMLQSVMGPGFQGMPSGITPNQSPPSPSTPQQAAANPAGAVAANIQQGQSVGQAVQTQEKQQSQEENNFYTQHNVPPDQNPAALKTDAQNLRQQADAIRFQPNKHPTLVKQMDDLDAQAKEKEARANDIIKSRHTLDSNGNDVEITPLVEMQNRQKSQETQSGALPGQNDKILNETMTEARTAQNIKASAQAVANLLYDDKNHHWNYKTGSFEGFRSTIANLLASAGVDNMVSDPKSGRTLSQELAGMNPGDDKLLAHIMGLAVPALTRENLQGQRTTQGEFMHFSHINPEPGDVPKSIMKMIYTQLIPEADYKIDRSNHLTQPKLGEDGKEVLDKNGDPLFKYDRATDDYAKALSVYDRKHNLNEKYNQSLDDWKKRENDFPSQSPFSNLGSGLKTGASHLLGFDQNKAPPQNMPKTIMKNGHQFILQPNGGYQLAPSSPTD